MTFRELLTGFDPETPAVAIDYETYYDDDCSVSGTSYWGYTHHPQFHAYMVSVYAGPDSDLNFVGDPREYDWSRLEGMLWLAHNTPFDERVHMTLEESGVIPRVERHAWVNTADLSVYLGYSRSLTKCSKALADMVLNKGVRADMKGKVFADLPPDQQQTWLDYAMDDAVACWRIWDRHRGSWPRREMLLSLHTTECVKRGVQIDQEALGRALDVLPRALGAVQAKIPWFGEEIRTPSGNVRMRLGQPVLKSPTSSVWFQEFCAALGTPAPESTDTKDPRWHAWVDAHRGTTAYEVASAMQEFRKLNRTLRICEQIRDRVRDDGRMEFMLMYYGARNTGRWSGKHGEHEDRADATNLNLLNLPRDHVYLDDDLRLCGVDDAAHDIYIRNLFVAPPGKLLGVSDLAQIEPRVLAYVAGNDAFLELLRQGMDPYEAHARTSMGYTDSRPLKQVDPDLRQYAKVRVLQLGYQSGPAKFRETARIMYGLAMTMTEAKREVYDYRAKETHIVSLWESCRDIIANGFARGGQFKIDLESGRSLTYTDGIRQGGDMVFRTHRGGSRSKMYGGKLVENLVQAFSRDVFAEGILRLESEGIPVLFHVYDEVVTEVPEGTNPGTVSSLMSVTPEWCPGLPVDADESLVNAYTK